MASQVPYSPAPSVAPQDSPTPYRETSTPIAAFGGAVAAATQHLGDVANQSGNELFAQAVSEQQRYDDAKATEAGSNFLNDAADLSAKYQTLQGKQAVDQLDPYKQSLEDLRTKMAGELNSPYTVQAYNQQTRFIQSRLVMAGASHAAEQNKQYAQGTLKAGIEANNDLIQANPSDMDSVFAGIADNKTKAAQLATEAGLDPTNPQTKLFIDKTASDSASKALTSLARTQPLQAQKYFQLMSSKGILVGDDIAKTNDVITAQMRAVGSHQIAQQATSGVDGYYGSKVVPIERAQDAIGGYESSNNYTQEGPTTRTGDHALGRYQVMGDNLNPWLKEAGMAPMTEAQFLADPKAQDQLFNSKFGQFMDHAKSFNGAANMWFTGSETPNQDITDATATTKGHTPAQYLAGTNARLAKSAPAGDQVDHATTLAQQASPNDPDLPQLTENHVLQMHSQQDRIAKDVDFNNKQTIDGAMLDAYLSGKPVDTRQVFADPKVNAAWEALNNSDRLKYAREISALASAPPRPTDEMKQQYNELKGLQVQDPEAFLKVDVLGMNLPWSMQKEFIDDKASVYKGEQADPGTTRALDVLAPKLQAANLTKTGDNNGLVQFTGALRAEMKQFTLDNARPPKDDEVEVMGSRLLQNQATGLKHTWPYDQAIGKPLYQVDVPSTAADIIRKDPKWAAYGITPTDVDIQQIYVYNLYQQQFGKSNAK